MADLNRYPIADVTAMADTSGFNLTELRSPTFTDGLLDAKMREFYAGTLEQVVNPGQGTRDPTAVFVSTFTSGVGKDVSEIAIKTTEGVRALASGIPEAVRNLGKVLELSPFIIVGIGALAVLIFVAK